MTPAAHRLILTGGREVPTTLDVIILASPLSKEQLRDRSHT